ncbi:uncharacterized protein LOC143692198 [Agelaius phoeniceus]|uniref:uncharacterized protein LOC143692198 n=1 Tax=Agelaius phoeniceus TaxID=39638 RepID=UPI0040552B10
MARPPPPSRVPPPPLLPLFLLSAFLLLLPPSSSSSSRRRCPARPARIPGAAPLDTPRPRPATAAPPGCGGCGMELPHRAGTPRCAGCGMELPHGDGTPRCAGCGMWSILTRLGPAVCRVRDGASAPSRDPAVCRVRDGASALSRDPTVCRVRDVEHPHPAGTPGCGGCGMELPHGDGTPRCGCSIPHDPHRGVRAPCGSSIRLIPGMLPQRSGGHGRRDRVCAAGAPLPRQIACPGLVWFWVGACSRLSGRGRCSRRCFILRGGILPSTKLLLSCRCCPSPALCRVLPRFKTPPERIYTGNSHGITGSWHGLGWKGPQSSPHPNRMMKDTFHQTGRCKGPFFPPSSGGLAELTWQHSGVLQPHLHSAAQGSLRLHHHLYSNLDFTHQSPCQRSP